MKTRIRNCMGWIARPFYLHKPLPISRRGRRSFQVQNHHRPLDLSSQNRRKSSFSATVPASSKSLFFTLTPSKTMPTSLIVRENHERDAAFSQALHGRSAEQKSAFMAMLSKDSRAQQVAADAYFHHWDNKDANIETKEDREVRMTGGPTHFQHLTNPYHSE